MPYTTNPLDGGLIFTPNADPAKSSWSTRCAGCRLLFWCVGPARERIVQALVYRGWVETNPDQWTCPDCKRNKETNK